VVLSIVSPIVVLSRGGLRVAPNDERVKISVINYYELKGAYLGFDLSLLCFDP